MEKITKNPELKKYLFFAITGLLLILSFFIIKPFITAILSGLVLAYLTKPLYQRLNKKLSETNSALLSILFVILIIFIPLTIISLQLLNQFAMLLQDNSAQELLSQLSQTDIIQNLNIDFQKTTEQIISFTINSLTPIIRNLPSFFMSLIVMAFTMFYSLKNWKKLSEEMEKYIPFKNKKKTAEEISETTRNIFYGAISISVIQFIVGLIGFLVLDIRFAFIFSILIFFFAFVPGLGPAIVWVPILVYAIITQNWFQIIGLLILGVILSFYIDSILRTKIMGDKSKINPVIMLLGILGGISMFGIFGFIIGPLILIYTIRLMQEIIN